MAFALTFLPVNLLIFLVLPGLADAVGLRPCRFLSRRVSACCNLAFIEIAIHGLPTRYGVACAIGCRFWLDTGSIELAQIGRIRDLLICVWAARGEAVATLG